MKTSALVCSVLLLTLVPPLLSTVVQATEYTEVNTTVNASDILEHIKIRDDINLTNCSIVGELNASNLEPKTVPNPYYKKLLNQGTHGEELPRLEGLVNNLSVIESNITIINSIFVDELNFSNVIFNNTVSFQNMIFMNDTYFNGSTFSNGAHFNYSFFNGFANFYISTFNNSANFSHTYFNKPTNFGKSTFNNSAYFYGSIFHGCAYFYYSTFNNCAYFNDSKFMNSIFFDGAILNNSAHFNRTQFVTTPEFSGPNNPDKLILDGKNIHTFISYYIHKGQYDDANVVYYNYQYANLVTEFLDLLHGNLIEFASFFVKSIYWITCGFGVKLSRTI